MMSIIARNYKLSKLENGPNKACSNHYHHPTMVWRAAKVSRGDDLAPLCFFPHPQNIPCSPFKSIYLSHPNPLSKGLNELQNL